VDLGMAIGFLYGAVFKGKSFITGFVFDMSEQMDASDRPAFPLEARL